MTQNDLPMIKSFAVMIPKQRAASQKQKKMIHLNDRHQSTTKLVTEWVFTMRILIAKKIDINHLEWIHEDAQSYISVQIGAEFSSATQDYSEEWTRWSFAKLASIAIRLWTTSTNHNMENSVKVQLKTLTPRIKGDDAF